MRWWTWLILVILALAVFILAVVYVVRRGSDLAQQISGSMGKASPYLEQMQQLCLPDRTEFRPAFTEPIRVSASRYSKKHEAVIRRKQANQNRHADTWNRWQSQPIPATDLAEESKTSIR
ncbi:hypothetical protein GA0061078_0372 [Bifidobacterium bohemicum]|uniref:Uncharacterized protein n=1 Tax=Bifidobacterium bohemicum DSM 22767 TaxID=1437606 RepID=A0A086ZJC0_9BIFI|nr:hypothetical protein [Bifidobacterium bohemicum]KFI46620.1 hypothetical protein BBOH_0092 [Bifidobacterium bohemicum DSM 22767]SCB76980.1 hypothetical protein GA0061078_0372 [Bifidobacterium bohemicum]